MGRAVDLTEGRAYVVTDLHGEWEPYARYRDDFLTMYNRGEADYLIFLGDMVHSYGPPEHDASLPMLRDVMSLQSQLGHQTVLMLLGNHELPHIYGVTLSKGEYRFTPRFEHALGSDREEILQFFKSLPFLVRTASGVMLTHAGAAPSTATLEAASYLLDFSHRRLLNEADELLRRQDVHRLLRHHLNMTVQEYEAQARGLLAIRGRDDPRFLHLLRSMIVTSLDPEWSLLWDFFFTQCETLIGARSYERVIDRFLETYSAPGVRHSGLVTGHMPTRGGFEIVARKQFRLASWTHAGPREAGSALLFDVRRPVKTPEDLAPGVRR